jgi:hypothetical protein
MEGLIGQPGVPLLTFGQPSGGKVSGSQRRFYLSPSGLQTGSYRVRTTNTQGYVDKAYDTGWAAAMKTNPEFAKKLKTLTSK